MKKVSKKKLAVLAGIIILIIIEIIAFGLSRSQMMKQITVSIIDSKSDLGEKSITLSAIDGGETGYYILLPEAIEGKFISEYVITKKQINDLNGDEESNITTENVTNVIGSEGNISAENSITKNVVAENTAVNNTLSDNTIIDNTTIENSTENTILDNSNNIDSGEDETDESDKNIEEDDEENLVKKLPGEKIFLTKDELEDESMTLSVTYDTKEVEEEVLYKTRIRNG